MTVIQLDSICYFPNLPSLYKHAHIHSATRGHVLAQLMGTHPTCHTAWGLWHHETHQLHFLHQQWSPLKTDNFMSWKFLSVHDFRMLLQHVVFAPSGQNPPLGCLTEERCHTTWWWLNPLINGLIFQQMNQTLRLFLLWQDYFKVCFMAPKGTSKCNMNVVYFWFGYRH